MNTLTAFFEKLGTDMAKSSLQHLYLTFLAVAIASAIAIPLGIYLTRTKHKTLTALMLGAAGAVQTIPALALIGFVVIVFSEVSLPTIGFVPGLVALVLYALLPILRNTYTGIRQVDPAVIEVARGMGMKPHQILLRVELPLALPVIMAGVRISTVWTIGIATLCGLIGAGGLGTLIFKGLRNMPRTKDYLIAGTVPAALMALTSEWILGKVETWLTPEGLKEEDIAR